MDVPADAPQTQDQLNWSLIVHIRLAIHDLQACQSQLFQSQVPCFAALIDARDRVDQAIQKTKDEMARAAND